MPSVANLKAGVGQAGPLSEDERKELMVWSRGVTLAMSRGVSTVSRDAPDACVSMCCASCAELADQQSAEAGCSATGTRDGPHLRAHRGMCLVDYRGHALINHATRIVVHVHTLESHA